MEGTCSMKYGFDSDLDLDDTETDTLLRCRNVRLGSKTFSTTCQEIPVRTLF